MRISIWFVAIVVAVMLVGCGERTIHPADLERYGNGMSGLDGIYDRFGLRHISSGAYEDAVHLEVRKRDPSAGMSEEELKKFKNAVYEHYDRKFPLEVKIWTLPEEPTVDGRITSLDDKGILAVAPREGEGKQPRAVWMSFGEDTVIVDAKTGARLKPEQLAIGYRIRAWGEMLMMESYPEQTGLMRLEVVEMDSGDGDVLGTITKVVPAPANEPWAREIHIDGKKYGVLEKAKIIAGEEEAPLEKLEEGDRVRAWLTGYEVMADEKTITQITVEK